MQSAVLTLFTANRMSNQASETEENKDQEIEDQEAPLDRLQGTTEEMTKEMIEEEFPDFQTKTVLDRLTEEIIETDIQQSYIRQRSLSLHKPYQSQL